MFLCTERRNYKKPLVWITEISIISVATFQRSDRVNVLIWSLWLCKYCYCDCYLIHSWPYNLTGGCFSPLICFPYAMKALKEVATDFHVNRNCFPQPCGEINSRVLCQEVDLLVVILFAAVFLEGKPRNALIYVALDLTDRSGMPIFTSCKIQVE